MNKLASTTFLLTIMAILVSTPQAYARGKFVENHPRRAHANNRLDRQNTRIDAGVASGKLTNDQAAQLKTNNQSIHAEIKADQQANGGHLTKEQSKQINQELHQQSQLIYQEKHP